jgi:SAM-dependent methyltransferase
VPSTFFQQLSRALRGWWSERARTDGAAAAASLLLRNLWKFARDSTPARTRQRYGDMDYDWDHRVDTTSGTVAWRARLLGSFLSPYQPTEPSLFQEMMAALPIEFERFTFIDLGSGKGRTLLMASDYPFRKIVGVELLPELHEIARNNLVKYQNESQKCKALEAICDDAANFEFPSGQLVLYLFNPLPESGLRRVMANLENSLKVDRRPVYVLYHNPLLDGVLAENRRLTRIAGTHQYSVYAFQS